MHFLATCSLFMFTCHSWQKFKYSFTTLFALGTVHWMIMRSLGPRPSGNATEKMASSDPNQQTADVKRHMMYISFSLSHTFALSTNAKGVQPLLANDTLHYVCLLLHKRWVNSCIFKLWWPDFSKRKSIKMSKRPAAEIKCTFANVSPFFSAGGEISVPRVRSRRRTNSRARTDRRLHSHQSTAIIATECDWFSERNCERAWCTPCSVVLGQSSSKHTVCAGWNYHSVNQPERIRPYDEIWNLKLWSTINKK